MTPLPPRPAHTVMSEGQRCLPVASMCVCVRACMHAHMFARMSVTCLDMGSVCMCLCVPVCMERVCTHCPQCSSSVKLSSHRAALDSFCMDREAEQGP